MNRDAYRERFVQAGGVLPAEGADRALLEAILASGEFLPELLLADVRAFAVLAASPWLRRPKPASTIAREVEAATATAKSLAELQRQLRLVRRFEMLRLGARELGWGTTEEVAHELSGLADACLEAAVRVCDEEVRGELGPPLTVDGEPGRFVVMAMGKLGGEELNFSSDVDVCYFYSTDGGAAGERSLHEYYAALSRRVSAALEELTADGTVFRVDLRLRPEGRNGPLCNSLAAAEAYYETFGRTWERQAWLRARPCAGDKTLGDELLAILEPFIYPRHIEPKMVDDVRSLRALFRDPADRDTSDGGFDVKLGAGGIRDVEMVVQALQLLHGGKRRDVRERNTPRALPRLVMAGLLSDREAWTLLEAYRFWRRLEHRVQVATGAQRHRIPGDDQERQRFGEGLGFPTLAAFDAEVTAKRAAVEAVAATLGEPPDDREVEAARLLDPLRSRGEIEELARAAGFRDPEAAADTLERSGTRLPASLVAEALASPDPDRALVHFRDLSWRGSSGLMTMLRDEPRIARVLGALFGTSDRLSDLLIHHAAAWDAFVDGLRAPVRNKAELAARLAARIARATPEGDGRGEDAEVALRAARSFQTEEILRIGLHDVAGSLDAPAVSGALSDLAEVCLSAVIDATVPGLEARLGVPRTGLTVLGLGSLGAREMRYGSDLDLVFVFGGDGESTTGVDHREWFARAGQRLISGLEALLEEGRLYQVDTRLRPSGEQGMLVTSWSHFERYHQEEAAGWERVALLRARVVREVGFGVGEAETARRRTAREALLTRLAFDRSFDEEAFCAEQRRIRTRVERERGRVPVGSRHLRFDPGGIMDIELLVALGQLQQGSDPGVRTTSTEAALARLVALGWPVALAEDHAFLRRAALRLRLLLDRPQDVVSPRELPILARSLAMTPAQLARELDERMGRVRSLFDQKFQTAKNA